MKNLSERIIEILKQKKRVSEADIEKALTLYAKQPGGKLRDILVQMGLIDEQELASLLSQELKIPFLRLGKYKLNPEMSKTIPEKLARKHGIIPVSQIGNTLTVAISDPFNIFAVDDIAMLTHHKVECVLSTEKDIQEAFYKLYTSEKESIQAIADAVDTDERVEVLKNDDEFDATHAMNGSDNSAPIMKMVELLLREALNKRASDIHIEPFENIVRVRYRIDGNLEEVLTIPKKNQNAVTSCLKIMSKLDITENRIPQDGRFKVKLQEKEVDFRVSVLPVHFGNKIVMRILDKSALSVGLEQLGFLPETLHAFKAAVAKPFGIILITGPTGSGKSTTLYSILNQLNSPDKNIITIEDPIEYQVKGITQIQAKPEIGMDFASGLRAVLRQSPDVVMVGEIRDSETADIAVKASLTGQLVLSTLHTNDAAGAVTRLIDMGIEPFLIASGVILVAAQRLCRKICPSCIEEIKIPHEVLEELKLTPEELKGAKFYKGKGCEHCGRTGYRGRLGVLETLAIDDAIRDLITRQASSYEIKKAAVKNNGMITLRQDALKKCYKGMTTLDEAIRITNEDE